MICTRSPNATNVKTWFCADPFVSMLERAFAVELNHNCQDIIRLFGTHLSAASKAPRTVTKRISDIDRLNTILDKSLLETTIEDLESLLQRRSHLAPETRKGMVSSWKRFFGWATQLGYVSEDPTARLAPIPIPVRVPRLAPDDAIVPVLVNCSVRDAALILLARMACLRLSELTFLELSSVQGDRIFVRGKGGRERYVYANDTLLASLNRQQFETEHLESKFYFPSPYDSAAPLHPQSVNKIITRVTGWNPHSLRHAGATKAYQATRDLRSVQLMLGHASMSTTQRYLHPDADELRAVANATDFDAIRIAS